jgi:hypothetical protein
MPTLTEQSLGYVLRIHGNGEAYVGDVADFLTALEYAYNSAYIFDSLMQQAEVFSEEYGSSLPLPVRNLLWINWWPPNSEKVFGLVPDEDRLKLRGVELNSPGFWDFLGALNPLEVLRQYLNDRHEQRKDREYREEAEKTKLNQENQLLGLQVLDKQIEVLKQLGATSQDISLLKSHLLYHPLQGLNVYQDQRLIVEAEIIEPESESKNTLNTNDLDDSSVEEIVLSIISEQTGFPIPILKSGLDMTMEADFGIESSKLDDIWVAVYERFHNLPMFSKDKKREFLTLRQFVNAIRDNV